MLRSATSQPPDTRSVYRPRPAGSRDRLAELHRVAHRVGKLAFDIGQNRCGTEHSVRDDGRETEQLGADHTGVNGVSVTADGGIAADLPWCDSQYRIGAAASAAAEAAAWARRTGWCAAGAGTS